MAKRSCPNVASEIQEKKASPVTFPLYTIDPPGGPVFPWTETATDDDKFNWIVELIETREKRGDKYISIFQRVPKRVQNSLVRNRVQLREFELYNIQDFMIIPNLKPVDEGEYYDVMPTHVLVIFLDGHIRDIPTNVLASMVRRELYARDFVEGAADAPCTYDVLADYLFPHHHPEAPKPTTVYPHYKERDMQLLWISETLKYAIYTKRTHLNIQSVINPLICRSLLAAGFEVIYTRDAKNDFWRTTIIFHPDMVKEVLGASFWSVALKDYDSFEDVLVENQEAWVNEAIAKATELGFTQLVIHGRPSNTLQTRLLAPDIGDYVSFATLRDGPKFAYMSHINQPVGSHMCENIETILFC